MIQLYVNHRWKLYRAIPAVVLVFFFLILSSDVLGQGRSIRPDTLQNRPGARQNMQQQGGAPKPEQEGQINFQAKDSLIFVFEEERIATLFGSSSVNHTSGQLNAGKISLNLDQHLVNAATQTPEDTLSQPVLTRENDKVRSNSIAFNYQTEKGRFEVARVNVQDGNLIGTKVKNTGPHVVFLEDAIYSTCMLDHPHYYIKADRMKVVDEEEVFFERARLYILDIPYPFVFPFGYLPGKIDQRQSGLLEPTYAFQQKETRGLGLQNFGWFQYFNDYLVGQASVDIFTSGSYYLNASSTYRKRDDFNGSVQVGYSKERQGLEPTDPDFQTGVQKRLGVNHSQDFSPYSSINADINLRTSDYYQRNSYDPNQRAETSTSSSINYRYRHPENLYNFNISVRQNQNFNTNVTRLSGPSASFSLKQFSPFTSDGITQDQSPWYENISIRYQNSFDSNYDFNPIAGDTAQVNWFEALLNPSQYREATGEFDHYEYGFRQQASISMGQLLPSRFLNVSANANYTEYWFPTTIRKDFIPETNEVVERQVRGFTTARDFNTGLNFSTTLYGLMNQKIGNIQSFRHTLRPTISLGYRPDFSTDYWGYYRTVQTDTTTGNTQRYSIFENEVFSGPGRGEQRSIGLSLNNVFEAKQVRRDSTGEKKENVIRLIDQLNFSTSYNFAADSLNLADLNASFSSRIISGLNIRANAQFNFYERNEAGTKIDNYLLTSSGKLFEMTSFSINTGYSFRGGDQGGLRINDDPHYPEQYNPLDQSIFRPVDPHFNNRPVPDFNTPWSFSVNLSYRWNLNPTGDNRKSATINASNIQFNLTPKWNFQTQMGYDFVRGEFTPSQFTLSRNLHCWNLNFTMNPFGDQQYYFFSLRVNAGRLQGILQKLPVLNNLERSSSPTGRSPRGF